MLEFSAILPCLPVRGRIAQWFYLVASLVSLNAPRAHTLTSGNFLLATTNQLSLVGFFLYMFAIF